MKTRYPARTALVTALALTFGASVFAADQVAQSSAGSSAADRSGTSAQDGTRSTDPMVNPGQSGFNDWTQRNNTAPGTRSNAQDTTTRGSNAQDRMSGAGAAGTMRDGMSRDTARQHQGTMMDGSMNDAMRRQHDGMMRGDAAAQQDRLNHIEPGASETRVYLYPNSGNAQAD